MARLSRTETVFAALAAAFFALAVGVRLGSGSAAAPVSLTAAPSPAAATVISPTVPPDGARIDINTADAETLTLLPGIGEKLAGRIIDYRTENGPFQDISALMQVGGIGEKKFADIRDYITAGGSS